MSLTELETKLRQLASVVSDTQRCAEVLARGRVVEFVTDFNGQPFGHSRPSLKGKRCKLEAVYLNTDGHVSFSSFETLDGRPISAGFWLTDIRFVE